MIGDALRGPDRSSWHQGRKRGSDTRRGFGRTHADNPMEHGDCVKYSVATDDVTK